MSRPSAPPQAAAQRGRAALALGVVALLSVAVFAPTLSNGFLRVGFDDLLILDNPDVLDLSWAGTARIFTTFREANYIPLTTLSFAVDHSFGGFDPWRYHLMNVLLHALNALLVWLFLRPLLRSDTAATLAALVFALHPLQLEAVTLAVQRKTLLAATFFLLSFLLYQRFFASERRVYYLGALLSFALSVLAKPITVPLPVALLLYESHFVRPRPRWREKIPFFAVALIGGALALAASHQVAAVKRPHGGDWFSHALVVSRAGMESVAALFLPVNLSPVYYYRLGSQYAPLNFVALIAVAAIFTFVLLRRRRLRWTYFCLGWFLILLLPESNIIPLAQLRPDRYLYLPLIGFALWAAAGFELALRRLPSRAAALRAAACAWVAALAVLTASAAPIWRSDVTAWSRVAQRHPWCGMAYHNLGVSHLFAGDPTHAAAALERALALKPDLPGSRTYLAQAYARLGRAAPGGGEESTSGQTAAAAR